MGEDALDAARRRATGLVPARAAAACGVGYEGDDSRGVFAIPFLGTRVDIAYPEMDTASPGVLPPHIVALLVYHLAVSDGSLPTGRWISFAELPGGGFYVAAFRGYTANAIVRRFDGKADSLEAALAAIGAQRLPGLADVAWCIPALPRLPLALLWWEGDDEFESRAELLFDETASRHLPTDGCAIVGSWLAATLARLAATPGA